MNEIAIREDRTPAHHEPDPTGGRLVAWAEAAQAANQLATALSTTAFVPAHFRGNVGDATAAILMGDELGLSPLAAFRSIYVVHGTPALYARGMVALAQSQGHDMWTTESSPQKVTVCGRRRGLDKVETSTWTYERARVAGYTANKKYQTNPEEMLYSKAAAEIARKIAADVLAGVPYSVEDLELGDDTQAPAAEPRKISRKKAEPVDTGTETPEAAPPDPDDAPPPHRDPEVGLRTEEQSKRMFAQFGELGLKDREEYSTYIATVIGREIESSKLLTRSECGQVIEAQIADLEARDTEGGEGA